MQHNVRYNFWLSLALAIAAMFASAPSFAQAPTRHVYLEEFTGTWCGYCPRGWYADNQLEQKYGSQVVIVCIHGPFNPGTLEDPFQTAQADSMLYGIGFPVAEGFSYPGGWTARQAVGTTWNVDPTAWIHPLPPFVTANTPGLADTMVGTAAMATVKVENVSYNQSTNMVTAKVTGVFQSALSGDFRLNLMVTEDSVTGPTGTPYTQKDYDQTNYYYNCPQLGDASNPLYNLGAGQGCDGEIAGFVHRHVFREAVGGVHGVPGIIPANPAVGTPYSMTFTFPLPASVLNPNHVSLVGIVHQYSATDLNGNEVYDAMSVPLSSTSIPTLPNKVTVTFDAGPALWAHAGGDSTATVSVENDGTTDVNVMLSVDPSTLPAGWSVKFSPSPVPVPAGSIKPATMTITAPTQSGYIMPTVLINPQETGTYIPTTSTTFGALSDNTRYPIIYDAPDGATGASIPTVAGLPDTMIAHAAIIPLSNAAIAAYQPENFPVSIYDNIAILDNGGAYSNPTILPDIVNAIASGNKVFFSSNTAMYFAEDPQSPQYASTGTPDVQDFYATLGLNFTSTSQRYNSTTGASTPYSIKGDTTRIGNAISVTNAGGSKTSIYSIDSNSVADFYSDGKPKNIVGSHYEDPVTHGRIVYLGFDLGSITPQAKADTIYRRSINWLLSAPSSGVTPTAPGIAAGISASPNPFRDMTQIKYVAANDERDVTFSAYDLLGRQVAKLATQASGNNTYTAWFDGSTLANGTYVIIANSSKGTHEVRVVNQQ